MINLTSRKAVVAFALLTRVHLSGQPVVLGVTNNATYSATTPLAKRSIVAVFGRNLTNGASCVSPCGPSVGPDGVIGKVLVGAQVSVAGIAVPVLYATPEQLGIQIASEVPDGPAPVVVTVDGTRSAEFRIQIEGNDPGIFAQNQRGFGAAAVTHANGATVTAENPARPGEVIILYATGLGNTNPLLPTGLLPSFGTRTYFLSEVPAVIVGGFRATTNFAGASPCCAGLDQVNFIVPAGVGSGDLSLFLITGKRSNFMTMATAGNGSELRKVSAVECTADAIDPVAVCTVRINVSASSPLEIGIDSGATAVSSFATVTIPSGATQASFVVNSSSNVSLPSSIKAVLNGSVDAQVTIRANPQPFFWTSVGPKGGKQGALATSGKLQAFALARSGRMYAAGGLGPGNQGPLTYAGAFRSEDGGANWVRINSGFSDPIVNSLYVDPLNEDRVLAGTEFGGMFISRNAGTRWTVVTAETPISQIVEWGNQLLAAAGAGILQSADRGDSWSVLSRTTARVRVLATSTDYYIAGLEDGRWLRGTRDGSIQALFSSNQAAWSATIDNTGKRVVVVSGYNPTAVRRSLDAGLTWADVVVPNAVSIQGVAFDLSSNVLYAAANGSLWSSSDSGDHWSRLAGATWDMRLPIPLSSPNALIVATDQGLFRTDNGSTWRSLSGSIPNYILTSVAVHQNRIVTGVQDYNGFVSADGGITWNPPVGAVQSGAIGEDGPVLINPGNDRYCYAWTVVGFQYSTDGCLTFKQTTNADLGFVSFENLGQTTIIAVDALAPSTVYVAAKTGILQSKDFGVTFEPTRWLIQHPTSIAVDPTDSKKIIVGVNNCLNGSCDTPKLFRTEDGGSSWTPAPTSSSGYPVAIAISPFNSQLILVGLSVAPSFGGGVLRSTDGGRSFTAANAGLPNDWKTSYCCCCAIAINALRFDPITGAVALATEYGIYLSTDGGISWRSIRGDAVPYYFSDLSWDSGFLYASTYGEGLLRISTERLLKQ